MVKYENKKSNRIIYSEIWNGQSIRGTTMRKQNRINKQRQKYNRNTNWNRSCLEHTAKTGKSLCPCSELCKYFSNCGNQKRAQQTKLEIYGKTELFEVML